MQDGVRVEYAEFRIQVCVDHMNFLPNKTFCELPERTKEFYALLGAEMKKFKQELRVTQGGREGFSKWAVVQNLTSRKN